jgi:NAD(P)H-hydrate repair Nnr-like enzyme with NAD(P)H-hydrate dehydratase domain
VLAGLTVGLLAKNPPLLAAAAASFVVKKTAEVLYQEAGYSFSSDDVAERVFKIMKSLSH